MVGKTISHYKILKRIGSVGGIGIVYNAMDLKLDLFVAIVKLSWLNRNLLR